ncbi:MAG: hypothetical protein DCC57_13740 [Chloroflexi bacterium]|nr:MAG: hypothetical protein DCC57_13740 [Chloroflexota bacterium]
MLPPPLGEAILLAYLDGETDPSVAGHLACCPHCRSRAAALAGGERLFRALLLRVGCPSPERWRDFYFHFLTDDESAAMLTHVHGCPYCARELLSLHAFLIDPAPVPVVASSARLCGRSHWWVATRLAEPHGGHAAGACCGLCGEQQWVYSAGEFRLGVGSHRDPAQPDRRILVGALFGENTSGWTVRLWHAARLIATTSADQLSTFSFAGLPDGGYELTLDGPGTRIYVPDLTLSFPGS